MAAAAVVIAAGERALCSVVAFSDRPIVLQAQVERRPPAELVDELLTLRGRGTTDLAAPWPPRPRSLSARRAPAGVVVLMSDCLPTAGGDPLAALAGVDRLHVLGTSDEPDSLEAARALARRGGRSQAAVPVRASRARRGGRSSDRAARRFRIE